MAEAREIDRILREELEADARGARFDPDRWRTVTEGRRRRRTSGRSLATVAAAVVVLALIATSLAMLLPLGDERRVRLGGDTNAVVTHVDRDDGLSISIPPAWTFREDPSGPDEPKTVFAIGSWDFPTGGECAPSEAARDLTAADALLWLIEYRSSGRPADFPPRPDRFAVSGSAQVYECADVPSHVIRFTDAGRLFQVHVALGPQATESDLEEALRTLDSLVVASSGCATQYPDRQLGDPSSGPPGTEITIKGAIDTRPIDEPGNSEPASPDDRFQVWWNLDPERWESALAGDPDAAVPGAGARRLEPRFLAFTGPEGDASICQYQIIVRAPRAQADTYPVVVLYGGMQPDAATWRPLPAVEFSITDDGCPEPPTSDPSCPEVAWIRDVIRETGFRIAGETSRAILVEQPDDPAFAPWQLYVQVMPVGDADAQGLDPSRDDTYRLESRTYGVELWSDGSVYSWDRDGVRVWVMPGPEEEPFPFEAVDLLVRWSTMVGVEPLERD